MICHQNRADLAISFRVIRIQLQFFAKLLKRAFRICVIVFPQKPAYLEVDTGQSRIHLLNDPVLRQCLIILLLILISLGQKLMRAVRIRIVFHKAGQYLK